jgi:predicted MFS family arabinose efflux permease
VLILAGVQLSHILDFVILMPLGPQLMRVLKIGTQEFSQLVSVYTLSAALSCFLASIIMDRFDRKRVLLTIYAGLVFGTFMCGLARTYEFLLVARIVTGLFGGLLQAIILSIVGDLVPQDHRGRATGMIMAAFAVSSVAGVPLGLAIANRFGWYATFLSIGALSLVNLVLAWLRIPNMQSHIQKTPAAAIFGEFQDLLRSPAMWLAALLIVSMMSVFALFPFVSPFLVQIVGIEEGNLPEVYFVQGIATIFAAPFVGKMSDRHGSKLVFILCSTLSIGLVAVFTHLQASSLTVVLVLNTLVAAIGMGRMTPSMDLINRSVSSKQRGGFMTLVASVRQLAASAAAYLGGLLLSGNRGMANFGTVGTIVALTMAVSIVICTFMKPAEHSTTSSLMSH